MSGWSTEDFGGSETTLYGLLVVGVSLYIKTLPRHKTEPCNLWTLGGDDGQCGFVCNKCSALVGVVD